MTKDDQGIEFKIQNYDWGQTATNRNPNLQCTSLTTHTKSDRRKTKKKRKRIKQYHMNLSHLDAMKMNQTTLDTQDGEKSRKHKH